MATPNIPNLTMLERYNSLLASINENLHQFSAKSGIVTNTMVGDFKAAGESIQELHNPIFKINAAMVESANHAKALGLNMEEAMTRASLRAEILVQRMEMIKARFISIPQGFMSQMERGLSVESDRIGAAAGIMRSEYANSIPEAQRVISEVRKVVIRESAPLPGDTSTHLDVLSQTIDDSLRMAKKAGKSIEEAQSFAAQVAGQIGAIGGAAGANRDSTIRFANALMSGSLTANSRLDLVERNPGVKNAMQDILKKRGADSISDIAKSKQAEVVAEILKKAMPQSQMDAASESLGGTIEAFQTARRSLFDFTRSVDGAFTQFEDLDITVFDEIKTILITLINPLTELMNAVIANPILDPMTRMARVVNSLNGYFGNTTKKVAEFQGMDFQEAVKTLGFMDFGKYLQANASEIVDRTVSGDKELFGMEMQGGTFAAKNLGKDIPSRIVNALVGKFRTGVDGIFSEINNFIRRTTFINGLDFGGSLGVVIAELINSMLHLFNQMLPVIISQTVSMFRRLKEQIDITELIQFLKLFNGMRNIWEQLQNKIAAVAEDAPKYFNTFTEGILKFSGTFAIVGAIVGAFGGVIGFAAMKINEAATHLVRYVSNITGQTGITSSMNTRIAKMDAAKERQRLSKMSEKERRAEGITGFKYDKNQRLEDEKLLRTPFIGEFLDQHRRYSEFFNKLIFNPLDFLSGVSTPDTRKNILQKIGGLTTKLQMPLMIGGMLGIAPEPLTNTVTSIGLAASVAGNVSRILGFKGQDENDPNVIARRERKEETYQELRQSVLSGDMGKAGEMVKRIQDESIGVFGKILKFIPGLGRIIAKIPPGLFTAFAAALPQLLGTVQLLIGIFKRAYEASPELQRAVARLLNGLRNLFMTVSRVVEPLYKKYILPLFQLIGDFFALILNRVMDIMNFFTGGAFGNSNSVTVPQGREAASEVGLQILDVRQDTQEKVIEQGKLEAGVSYKGFIPGDILTIPAAKGFGDINIPSLMAAATTEAKMMPANERLILANTSETILTKEQMQSGRLMNQSHANINIPKIDILINSSANHNPQMIANEVASVLMGKLRDLENTSV